MTRSLFALAALVTLVGVARSDDLPGPKIKWPEIKGLTRGKTETFPKAELGYSVPYDAPDFAATVYVYNLGLKKITDGAKSDEAKGEMKRAVSDLHRAKKAGFYKSVKEVGKEETVPFDKAKGSKEALRLRFEVERKDGVKLSEVYVTGYKDHFVKIRITHEPDDKAAAERITALLEGLGKAIE
jgi:hypothetical protein